MAYDSPLDPDDRVRPSAFADPFIIMHVLLIPYGVAGDVLPLVSLGMTLRRRGHRATLVACGYFRTVAEKEGLGFIELYPAEEYLHEVFGATNDRLRFIPFMKLVGEKLLLRMREAYAIIADQYVPGETVVAAQGWLFGARIAQEKLGVPLATVHMQPMLLGSVHDRGRIPVWLRRIMRRLFSGIANKGLGPDLNAFRAGLGLPPVANVLPWANSPQMVLGLFPEWYSPPQPDWPPNWRLVGFPLVERERQAAGPPDELDEFIAAGDPPLIFSQGSAGREVRDFFRVSAEVAHQLGRRALFLTPHPEQVPKELPPGVRYFGFVPFRLPKRAAAHVHHGGVGTIAYTLAAGIPQLAVPLALDQPDNCRRLQRLGVSDTLRPRQYRTRKVVPKLKALLESSAVAERCRFYAARCREANALERACAALEELPAKHRPAR
jgi:UDP:flavonoid glycosyltransferase YjiC (YdhE family)